MASQANDMRSRRRSRSMTAADSVAERRGRWFQCFVPPKAASFGNAVKGRFLIVFGAGTPNFNGVYHAIGMPAQPQSKASFASTPLTYRKMHGPEVIMHYRGWWLFAQKDRPESYYGVKASDTHFPPDSGWQLKHGQGPAPYLQVLDSVDEIPQPLRERGLDACSLEVHGSGTVDFNGVYDVCGVRGGKLRYRKRAGLQAIVWYSGWWLMNEEGHGETFYGLHAKDSGPMPPTGAIWSPKSGQAPVPTVSVVTVAPSTPRSRARTPPRLLAPVAEAEESDQRATAEAIPSEQRVTSTTLEAQEPDDVDDLPGWPKAVSSHEPAAQVFEAPIEVLLNHCTEALLGSDHQSKAQLTTDIVSKIDESASDACSTDELSSGGSTPFDADALRCQSSTESEEQTEAEQEESTARPETRSSEAECASPCVSMPGGARQRVRGHMPSGLSAGPKPREPAPWMLTAACPVSLDVPPVDVDSGVRDPMRSGLPAGPKPREPAPWTLAAAGRVSLDAPLPDVDASTATEAASMFSQSASHKVAVESIPDLMPEVVERVGFLSRGRRLQDKLLFRPLAGLEPKAGAEVPAPGFVSQRVAEFNSLSNSLR